MATVGTATSTLVYRCDWGNLYVEIDDVVPNTYTTGGITLPATIGVGGSGIVYGCFQLGNNTAGAGYSVQYNNQTSLLQIFTGGAEVSNSTSLATLKLRLVTVGL